MKRSPLLRKSRLKARRDRPRRMAADRVRDKAHLAKVRAIGECASSNMPGARCKGRIQAAHQDEGKGAGMKTSDLNTIPQCLQCHADWGANSGPFKGWTKAFKRAWFTAALIWTRFRLDYPVGPRVDQLPVIPF